MAAFEECCLKCHTLDVCFPQGIWLKNRSSSVSKMQLIIKPGLQCLERQKTIKHLRNMDIYLKLLQNNAAHAKWLNFFQCETAKQQELTARKLNA